MIKCDVFKAIKEIIQDQNMLDDEALTFTEELNLENDLQLDSLDKVEILMEIEEKFDIEIGDDEAEKCITVKDVVALVKSKLDVDTKADFEGDEPNTAPVDTEANPSLDETPDESSK